MNKERGETVSECRRYRYLLWRSTECDAPKHKRPVTFIIMNPTKAKDEDDLVTRKCTAFAKAWGFKKVLVVSLFAYFADKFKDLKIAHDRELNIDGPENLRYIMSACKNSDMIVAAWGTHGELEAQDVNILFHVLNTPGLQMHHLGLTAKNMPKSPAKVSLTTPPTLWEYTKCRECGAVACMAPGDWDLCLEHTHQEEH